LCKDIKPMLRKIKEAWSSSSTFRYLAKLESLRFAGTCRSFYSIFLRPTKKTLDCPLSESRSVISKQYVRRIGIRAYFPSSHTCLIQKKWLCISHYNISTGETECRISRWKQSINFLITNLRFHPSKLQVCLNQINVMQ